MEASLCGDITSLVVVDGRGLEFSGAVGASVVPNSLFLHTQILRRGGSGRLWE